MNVLSRRLEKQLFQLLVTLMRVFFGIGWLLAGITKITEKHWFSEPGIFLKNYLIMALEKPNVPEFYHDFIQYIALKHIMFFNYTIPIVQIVVGICMIVGLMIIPSVCICLFMHINFILSGNMNLTSLTLYTSAFGILFFLKRSYVLSLDRYLGIEKCFNSNRQKFKQTIHYNLSKVS
ncbi:hypothetical protein BACCIP111899_01332 [Bacillus rhizoplanae]|uniref:Thiosulfate dehydrogenase [quinone] large subunit n=1 Tax=Bacillus rhizoplanae TaxID=2880966 RepID=A0ABN7ZXY2_9BACI|nr:hypothetical protein [Bacillus rhizoplanae]CAG9612160.1 hypothetical protein BACCIP111899_01332 [Bacillus rhizoplanae]